MARRRETKRQPPFGLPREVVLLTGRDEWPYTFVADGASGGCGKVPMPSDAAAVDVQAAVFTTLAGLTRSCHGVEIDIAWASLTTDSWVGRITSQAAPELPPGD